MTGYADLLVFVLVGWFIDCVSLIGSLLVFVVAWLKIVWFGLVNFADSFAFDLVV